jgi:hypothetical protein
MAKATVADEHVPDGLPEGTLAWCGVWSPEAVIARHRQDFTRMAPWATGQTWLVRHRPL